MKKRFVNWFKGHKVLRAVLPSIMALLLVSAMLLPSAFASSDYLDVEGTYTVTGNIPVKYLDGTTHPAMPRYETLTLAQADQVITGTLTMFGGAVVLTGVVGKGSRPYIVLNGDDGADTYLSINGRVSSRGGVVTAITGQITGYTISDGEKWATETGTAETYAGVSSYGGAGYSTELEADGAEGVECVQFNHPVNRFKLSGLDTLTASARNGISFWYSLTGIQGPQIGLRFSPAGETGTSLFSSVAHVDVTIAPYMETTGTGVWAQCVLTSASPLSAYFGNAPDDLAAFSSIPDGKTLADAEALINDEDEMKNGTPASASNWTLTAVYIDLVDWGVGNPRSCYIDNVQIGKITYTLEPNQFSAAFRAKAD